MHALAWEGRELVGHTSVVQRGLIYRGRALRAGYVEGVAVRAESEHSDVYVFDVGPALDVHEALTCDWREGDIW